jgi:hypothetical protein
MRAPVCLSLLAACSFSHGSMPSDTQVDGGPPDMQPTDHDRDGDGVPDNSDNCPYVFNQDQADEDGDGVGDVCDDCPHISNANQADGDNDGVGDVCDPHPSAAGDHILLFLPFNNGSEIASWTQAGASVDFVVTGGKLVQQGDSDLAIIWNNSLAAKRVWVTTHVTYVSIATKYQFNGAAVMTEFQRPPSFGTGAGCGEMRDTMLGSGAPFYDVVTFDGSGYFNSSQPMSGAQVAVGHAQTYQAHADSSDNMNCTVGSMQYAEFVDSEPGTGINLAVWGAVAAFDYVIAID